MTSAVTRSPKRNSSNRRSFRPAFTLLEILVMIAIITVLAGVSVLSIATGKDAARQKGVTRDVFAIIRYARSSALASRKPSIITYSTVKNDGEVSAKVEVVTVNETSGREPLGAVQTLSGEPVKVDDDLSSNSNLVVVAEDGSSSEPFIPISDEVAAGMRIKVVKEDEMLDESDQDAQRRRSKVSVFSNVDFLLGRYSDYKKKEPEKDAENDSLSAAEEELQPPVSFVWESNGRVEPHRVYIYPDGSSPDRGLMIRIDRFGAAKVVSPEDDDWQ
jgi:Tfp pilus assembly protein FimT